MVDLVPLNLLQAGQLAVVDQVVGRADTVHRLNELGLRIGVEIEMIQPGSPSIVRLAGHKLCFRADEALHVLVRQAATAGATR